MVWSCISSPQSAVLCDTTTWKILSSSLLLAIRACCHHHCNWQHIKKLIVAWWAVPYPCNCPSRAHNGWILSSLTPSQFTLAPSQYNVNIFLSLLAPLQYNIKIWLFSLLFAIQHKTTLFVACFLAIWCKDMLVVVATCNSTYKICSHEQQHKNPISA